MEPKSTAITGGIASVGVTAEAQETKEIFLT
jgi:hypothetical protein